MTWDEMAEGLTSTSSAIVVGGSLPNLENGSTPLSHSEMDTASYPKSAPSA